VPPKAIVFDLFHTLTGLESEWCDLPWTSDVLGIDRAVWNAALTTRSRWRLAGEEKDPYRIVARLAREIDPRITDETLLRAVEVRTARFRHSLSGVPAANVETLRKLRAAGLRLGLISNADVMEVAAWADSPLAGLFDVEVFSCLAGCVKPEPEIFASCLEALEVTAQESIFVGDGSSDELIGAKAVGMKTVFVSGVIRELWPEKIAERAAIADYHVAWVPEVLGLLGLAPARDADRVKSLLASLQISPDTLAARGLVLHSEATTLEVAETGEDGREQLLTPAAAEAWRALSTAARSDVVVIRIVSAFRSVQRQAEIVRAKLERGLSLEEILRVSAPPGYSEHHSGRAVDLTTEGVRALEVEFENTAAFEWLSRNAQRFGFSLSYPRQNRYGYAYEPWHWCFRQSQA